MKALIISLQRLGDIVMATPAVNLLKSRGYEVHMLINKNFRQVTPLLRGVKHVHTLDRKAIEMALVEPNHAIFEGYDRLRHLIEQLTNESFDCVVNLTHNQLAGRFTPLIPAPEHIGLQIVGDDVAFGSPWFRYLNRLPTTMALDHFHLSDIFQFALGAESAKAGYSLQQTPAGKSEWTTARQHLGSQLVLVQPFSSEVKKQWDESLLIRCLLEFERQNPAFQVVLLGAPFEEEPLWSLHSRMKAQGSRSRTVLLSLEGAFSALCEARLLMTTDTAIKHLAAATVVPVVEIALGSSDPSKTGIYKQNQYILRSREKCAPCPHGGNCSQPHHLCGESLHPDAVAQILSAVLVQDHGAVERIARRHSHRMQVLKTHVAKSGYWMAAPVMADPQQLFHQGLEKSALKLAFSSRPEEMWQHLGTEGYHFKESFQTTAEDLAQIEQRLNVRLAKVEQLKTRFQQAVRTAPAEIDGLTRHIHELLQECELHEQHPVQSPQPMDLSTLRRMQQALAAIEQKNSIQLKLIRHSSFQEKEIP
jgi:ADP-heptose:LPS heptosyltransferase